MVSKLTRVFGVILLAFLMACTSPRRHEVGSGSQCSAREPSSLWSKCRDLLAPRGSDQLHETATPPAPSLESLNTDLAKWGSVRPSHLRTSYKEFVQSRVAKNNVWKRVVARCLPELTDSFSLPSAQTFADRFDRYLDEIGVPEKLRIRPGVAVCNPCEGKTRRYLFLRYNEPIPAGYMAADSSLSGPVFLDALHSGIMPLNWSAEWNYFGIVMLYHDLAHLVAFTDMDYLSATRKLIEAQMQIRKIGSHNFFYGKPYVDRSVVSSFIEDFAYLPDAAGSDLNRFLSQFHGVDGRPFNLNSQRSEIGQLRFFSPQDIERWEVLRESLGPVNFAKMDSNIEEDPQKRAQNLAELRRLAIVPIKLIYQVKAILKKHLVELGGAAADGLSFQSPVYFKDSRYSRIYWSLDRLEEMFISNENHDTTYSELDGRYPHGIHNYFATIVGSLLDLYRSYPNDEANRILNLLGLTESN